jgi:hypothetical protein
VRRVTYRLADSPAADLGLTGRIVVDPDELAEIDRRIAERLTQVQRRGQRRLRLRVVALVDSVAIAIGTGAGVIVSVALAAIGAARGWWL